MKPTNQLRFVVGAMALIMASGWGLGQTTRPVVAARGVAGGTDARGNPIRVAAKTGHVSNYDESKVGTYTLPDPLVMSDGRPVISADMWYSERRPEILELYRREIYGRVPENAPAVTWEVASSESGMNGIAIVKHLVGHIGDKPDGPKMNVTLYTPTAASGAVPVVLCLNFNFGGARGRAGAGSRPAATGAPATLPAANGRGRGAIPGGDPIADILGRGWAYATIYYTDIQPDSINTFTSGVIGLTLPAGKTAPAADEWGTISAWAWGTSRVVDYFQTDSAIDAAHIAIMGHSRLGKTVLWAMAQDTRIAACFSSCAGELGSSLARRDFGETVDDMAQNFPYQFAQNLQKYVGRWNEMPVDTHMLISLCAPRPLFIGGGSTDQWSDPVGEFYGAVAAGPVYRMLGRADLGTTVVPELDHPLISGDLAYNYHVGGHMASPTDWRAFLTFAGKYFPGKATP